MESISHEPISSASLIIPNLLRVALTPAIVRGMVETVWKEVVRLLVMSPTQINYTIITAMVVYITQKNVLGTTELAKNST